MQGATRRKTVEIRWKVAATRWKAAATRWKAAATRWKAAATRWNPAHTERTAPRSRMNVTEPPHQLIQQSCHNTEQLEYKIRHS